MKKIKITKRVADSQEKNPQGGNLILEAGEVVSRSPERAQAFIDKGVATEYGDFTELTLDELGEQVANVNDPKELDKLEKAEKAGSDRTGAAKLFEKRREELSEPKAEESANAEPAKAKGKK